jgi:undecaprenyl-diphosphatase
MTTVQAIILGIVEGLTEFLPVSSTGHMSLVSHFLNIVQSDQLVVFEIAIQLGAILAVVLFYWKKFFDLELIKKLIVAFLPTSIIGLTVFKYLKTLLSSEYIIALSLIIGGIILIIAEKLKKDIYTSKEEISYKDALLLGLAQSVAIIPGVSRSGATIVAGLFMNIKRNILVEFTFLLAVPTMFAATLYSLYKNKELLTSDNLNNIGIGFIVAFLVALIVIKMFLGYIKKFDFIPFGIYRILVGIIVLLTLINF